jgi:hypothetical protein
MKPGMLTQFLAGAFVFSALIALGLSAWYVISLRQLHQSHPRFLAANHNRAIARSMLADALEYRKRNPAIDAVLQAANVIAPGGPTNSAPRPALPR